MSVPFIKNSFAAGEISPALWGRSDLAKYHSGASTMRNFFVNFRGGAITRAGTKFVGHSRQPGGLGPPRLIRYQFNVNQGYVLEFGQGYMRVISDGGYVTEPSVAITNITQSDPCQIFVTTLLMQNGILSNGDEVYLHGINGMTELNGNIYIAENVNPITNSFTINDTFGVNVSSTAFNAYISGGTVARVFNLQTVYNVNDLPWLKYTQSADVMTLTCVNQDTGSEYTPYDLARITPSQWTLTETTFKATISAPTTCTTTTQNTTSPGWTYQYVVTAVSAATGDESIASPIGEVDNAVNAAINANTLTVTWTAVSGAASYNIYRADPALGSVPAGAAFGYVGSATGTQFTDSNITADMTTTPPKHHDPFARSAIASVQVTAAGTGLTQSSVGYTISTITGSGAVLEPIVVNGSLAAVVVVDGGQGYSGSDTLTITPNTGTAASGFITFSTSFTNGQTVVLNGVTWTMVTTVSGPNQTQIGTSLATTLAGLAGGLSASTNASLTVANYRTDGVSLDITYNTPGTAGNAYTLSAGTSSGVASGTTLTGGSGSGSGAAAVMTLCPSSGTYPGGAAYFQQRRFYFNTLNSPDTYFASQPGSYNNMDTSIPVAPSDAIVGTPWAQQINGIQAMVPMQSGLVILTGSGAWQLTGGAAQTAVTPGDQDATPQAYNGINPKVAPITVNFDILYVQEKGSIVRDLAYNFFVNIFTGSDKTEISSHLFTDFQVTDWAYAEEPYRVIWAVRDDGVLLSLTYLKEEDVNGWARHDTNGLFVAVASVTEPPVDAVYVCVKRYIPQTSRGTGQWVYYIERMDNRTWQVAEDAWCVDCGLSYPQNEPSATLTPSAVNGTQNITSINLVQGGFGYVSPVATAVDPTGKGTGATFTVTQTGGAITSITPLTTGQGYSSQTVIDVFDQAGPGTGCIAYPNVTNIITFTADSSVFTGQPGLGAVGDVIRCGGGIATVTAFIGGGQVSANVTTPITAYLQNDPNMTPVPQAPGSWSIINPVSTISGLDYLDGMTVSILADGGVQPAQVVQNGSINLETAASQIIVGLPFTAQLQTLYMDAPGVQPTMQGRRKQIPAMTVRTVASRGMQVGGNQPDAATQPNQINVPWTNMVPIAEMGPNVIPGQPIPLITGDNYCHPAIGFDVKGQMAIQITDPVPCEITALVPEVTVGDDPSQ